MYEEQDKSSRQAAAVSKRERGGVLSTGVLSGTGHRGTPSDGF